VTSALEIVEVAFAALSAEEQDEALARMHEQRLERLAGEQSRIGKAIESLMRVREHLDPEPLTSTRYREGWRQLKKRRGGIEPLRRDQGLWLLAPSTRGA
jgi:hypothetical protein